MFRERERVLTPVGTRSRTKQSFASESDVNAIMRKYLSSGVVPPVVQGEPRYGDFTNGTEYFDAMVRVRRAEEIFASLPVKVRVACDHDPRKLLDLVAAADSDPKARELAEELGVIDRKPGQPEVPIVPAEPAVAPPAAPAEGPPTPPVVAGG